ncbi:MAG TPA: DUF58 domain-containing protein [Myxococcales bacterium]|nr:DUF58 domain-containing protein [Myxococcales bacterium]
MSGRPVPTARAAALAAAALVPAVLALLSPGLALVAAAVDVAAALLCVLDYALAPPAAALSVRRKVEAVLSSGVSNPVALALEWRGARAVRGELRDVPPPGMASTGHRLRFRLSPGRRSETLRYRVTPSSRGDAAFGDVHVRLEGPLGLCARQVVVQAGEAVKVYPDLTALSRSALELARAADEVAARPARRRSEGREFESLREYRTGDDARTIDWKASARRAKTMVRLHRPEQDQPVMLVLDCGRHMAGRVEGRRKLDHAVDAALRLARVSLDQGDLVGVVAFAREVQAHVPPRKGAAHLRELTRALYRVEATLEESDYGRALDVCFARHHKRTLVVVLSDLLDLETSAALVRRALALAPRHLPLVASLHDRSLAELAEQVPESVQDAYERQVAARLEDEYRLTAARLRDAGALVVRAPAASFSAEAVNAYLRVKREGRL